MGRLFMVASILALGGCQSAPPAANAANHPTSIIPPAVSRPIVEPDGNVVQCTAFPGPGAAGACVQE